MCRLLLCALAMLAGLTVSCNVTAQIDEMDVSRVPRRMGTSEFYDYVDLLRLSPAQMQEADRAYDNYLESFVAFQREMAGLLADHPDDMMFSEDSTGLVAMLPALVDRVMAMDETLFAQLARFHTEQDDVLQRAQWKRERAIYNDLALVEMYVSGGVPCLSDLYATLDSSPEVMAMTDGVLADYERRFTSAMREVFHAAVEQCSSSNDDSADRLVERVHAIRALNRRTFSQIHSLLPATLQHQWYGVFYRNAYAPAWHAAHSWLIVYLEAALAHAELSEAERQQLSGQLASLVEQRNKYVEEVADLLDLHAIRRAQRNEQLNPRDLMQRGNEIRQTFGASHYKQRRELEAMLGERVEQLGELTADYDHYNSGARRQCDIVVSYYRIASLPGPRRTRFWSNDEIVARPISRDELNDDMVILGVEDPATQEIIVSLHTRYRDELDTHTRDKLRALEQTRRQSRREISGAERIEKLDAMRAEIRTLVEDADRAFFADLQTLLGLQDDDPRLGRIFAIRSRVLWSYARLVIRREVKPNQAAYVDVVRELAGTVPGGLFNADISALLDEYDTTMAELLKQQRVVVAERERGMEVPDRSGQGQLQRQVDARKAHHALAAFNHEMITKIAADLAGDDATVFRDACTAIAYPEAWKNPADMDPALRQAVTLDDLQPTQRDALLEHTSTYAAESAAIREHMIALCAAYVPDFYLSGWAHEPDRIAAGEQYRIAMSQLRDLQGAANRRALRGIRSTLTPMQLSRINLPRMR